jgi:hypothetical protein
MKTIRPGDRSMMLRLVLVGMVAALGVSIPGKPSSENWFDSADAWATALFAEWDTWEPIDGRGSTVGTQSHKECEECRLARMRVAASAMAAANGEPPARKLEESVLSKNTDALARLKTVSQPSKANKSVTVEPFRFQEPLDFESAYELNGLLEGLVAQVEKTPEHAATTSPSVPALPVDDVELEEWDEVAPVMIEPVGVAKSVQIAAYDDEPVSCLDEEWASIGSPEDAPKGSDSERVLADLPRDVFTPEARPAALAVVAFPKVMPAIGSLAYLAMKPTASAAIPAKPAVKPFTGAIPPIGTLVYASRCWNAAPLVAASPTVAVRASESALAIELADLPRDVFAPFPCDFVADLPEDVFTPASAALAQKLIPSPQPLAGTQSQPPRLGDAVELTRRAVSAWVSVLIGPALVDVSRR